MTQSPDPQALFQQAISFHQNGQLDDAERLYRQCIEALPPSAEPYQMLGVLMLRQGRNGEALDLFDAGLKINPNNAEAHGNCGNALKGLGRFEEALVAYDKAIAINPVFVGAHYNRALMLQELRRFEAALVGYKKALALQPHFIEALHNCGILLMAMSRDQESLAFLSQAIALRPDFAEGWLNRGKALRNLGRHDEALENFEKVVAIQPDFVNAILIRGDLLLREFQQVDAAMADFERVVALNPDLVEAWNAYGNALYETGRLEESLECFDRALVIDPGFAATHYNRGLLLHKKKYFNEALASYDRALAIKPDYIEALHNRGTVLLDMKCDAEALASIDKALSLRPGSAETLYNRGNALRNLQRYDEALMNFDQALAVKSDFTDALYNRGVTLRELNRYEEALASYDKALAIKPDFAAALHNRGVVLEGLHRFDEALASYERARAIDSNHIFALGGAASAALHLCAWPKTTKFGEEIVTHVAESKSVIQPLTLLGYNDNPALQLQCAKRIIQDKIRTKPRPIWDGTAYHHDKIRVAYLSADFKMHPVAVALAELFERHDRSRFEVFGISLGPDDGSELRARLAGTFDQFYDVQQKDSRTIAELLRGLEVDIAVDLNGHTEGGRSDILAHRPVPVQVNYIGYAGTTGADFMDYVIADKIVLPFDQQPYFTENIVHLPDHYLAGDSRLVIAEENLSRIEAGLPEKGFVFCCFNNNWKITAPIFDIWMRLLTSVPDSVLWLRGTNPSARRNLRLEAGARGIEPQRLVFASKVELSDHFARHRLADLFLDTFPFNAHSTASDALRSGLPLVTCIGKSFSSRVAASLLHAAGVSELIAHDLEDYERLALNLARDPVRLESLRLRLRQNRITHPLFDADRFRRGIEAAYTQMWEIAERGEVAKSFSV